MTRTLAPSSVKMTGTSLRMKISRVSSTTGRHWRSCPLEHLSELLSAAADAMSFEPPSEDNVNGGSQWRWVCACCSERHTAGQRLTPEAFASLPGVDLLQPDAVMREGLPSECLGALSTHGHSHLDGLLLCRAGLLLDPTGSDESDVPVEVASARSDVEVEDGDLSDDDQFIPSGVLPPGGHYIEPVDGWEQRRRPVSPAETSSDSSTASSTADSESQSVSDTSSSDGDVNEENRDRFGDVADLLRAGLQTSEFSQCPVGATPDIVAVCRSCVSELSKGELPVCALANHNVWGDVPAELQGLSCSEEMLISLVRHRIYVRSHPCPCSVPPPRVPPSLFFLPSLSLHRCSFPLSEFSDRSTSRSGQVGTERSRVL
jgi:hypothetical protein